MRDLTTLVDGDRLHRYARLTVACYALVLLALLLGSSNNIGPDGRPLGADFITFWSAGRLTLAGNAADAFDAAQIFAMQRAAAPDYAHIFLWHYPPTFQLVATGLGTLPYLVAYYGFVAASLALFVLAMKPLVPSRYGWLVLLALPGTLICVLHGQNSLVSAALLATAVMCIDRRPVLAGICIGLLAYKPQLGMLFPLVLALTGRWRVVAAAALTAIAFAGLSVLAFGADLWALFFRNLEVVRTVVENGELPWSKMPSAFVFLRKLGVPQEAAYACQTLLALAVAAMTALVWRRCGPTLMAGASLIVGTLLLTPYTFDYELAILAVPLAIVARHLARHGASTGEKVLLLALALSPLTMGSLVDATSLQLGFLALLATFAWCVHFALTSRVALHADVPALRHTPIVSQPG